MKKNIQESAISTYSWVRGFNYQPSWGTHGISIWLNFNDALFTTEIERGMKYFPKMNTLRIWLSFDAYMEDCRRYLQNIAKAYEIMRERNIKIMPVLFCGWHSIPDFGGFCVEQLDFTKRYNNRKHHRQYVRDVLSAFGKRDNVLMYDIANEPFNSVRNNPAGTEAVRNFLGDMVEEVRMVDDVNPITIGSQGFDGNGANEDFDLLGALVDVFCVHSYYWPEQMGGNSKTRYLECIENLVENLNALGKPVISNECCWGSLDDEERVDIIRFELGLLKKHGIGFLPHALHHSRVADLHLPEYGPIWGAGYMAFINPDGELRPGHEVYNEF